MRRILRYLFVVLTISILAFIGFYIWLNQRLQNVISREAYTSFVADINASRDLPPRFHEIFALATGCSKTPTTNILLLKKLIGFKKDQDHLSCPCVNVNHWFATDQIDSWTIGLALDNDVTPQKCMDYYLSKCDFSYSVIGIQNASQFYYNKDVEDLTDEEMLELSIMTIDPTFYNKLKNPDNLEEKILEIKNNG